jgi:cell shape-determining protein MreC
MKMSFLRKNKNFVSRRVPKNSLVIGCVIAVCIILSLIIPGWKNILATVGTPLWNLRNAVSDFITSNAEILSSKSALSAENQDLKNQINQFGVTEELLNLLKTENDGLKALLNRKSLIARGILGVILAKPNFSPYDTLIIDVGADDGVSVGDKVLSQDSSTYIGSISDVYAHQSKVLLYSSPGEHVQVLLGASNVMKDAVGAGGGNFTVEVPREFNVKVGDAVVIPSISPNIFGAVEQIDFKEVDPFETVLFKTPVNVSEMKWVVVMPSGKLP